MVTLLFPALFNEYDGRVFVRFAPRTTRRTRQSPDQGQKRRSTITVPCPLSKYWLRPRQSPAVFLQTCRQPAYLKMWRTPDRSRRPLLPQIGTHPGRQCMCSWLASTFTGRPCCNPVSGSKWPDHFRCPDRYMVDCRVLSLRHEQHHRRDCRGTSGTLIINRHGLSAFQSAGNISSGRKPMAS
jgi:hypothetical protein